MAKYVQVDRTGVDMGSIGMRLYETKNTTWVLLFQLSTMCGLYRQFHLITDYQISQELPILARPTYEAMLLVVA